MKIPHSLTLAIAGVPALVKHADGYYIGGFRPYSARAKFSASPQERAEYFRKQQERINRAFEELQRDLEREKQAGGRQSGTKFRYGPAEQPPVDPFRMDEESLRKQREWVGRAFDIAADLNADFAPSPEEAKKNDEFIRKSRDWIDRMYGIDDRDKEGCAKASSAATFEPRCEVRSTNEKFEVALDVPGVSKEDIDISLEKDGRVLVIEGERKMTSAPPGDDDDETEQSVRRFAQKFELEENVQSDEIGARLDKGVLVVFAPKKVEEESDASRKSIPIM